MHRISRTATELSCAPRNAPEPDSQHKEQHRRALAQRQHGMTAPPHAFGGNTNKPIEEPSHEDYSSDPAQRLIAAAGNGHGDYRIRTDDPLLAKQVLYQLS